MNTQKHTTPYSARPSAKAKGRSENIFTRESVAILSAVVMLLSGVILAFIAYFRSPSGEISESVLCFTAQCLIYAGSIFGVSIYVQTKFAEMRSNLGLK